MAPHDGARAQALCHRGAEVVLVEHLGHRRAHHPQRDAEQRQAEHDPRHQQRARPARRALRERDVPGRDVGEEADRPEAGAEQQQDEQADDVDRRTHGHRRAALEHARPCGPRARRAVRAARDPAGEAEHERADEQAEVGRQALADQAADRAPVGRRLAEVEVQERGLQVVAQRDEDEAVVAGAEVRAQRVDRQPGQGGHPDDHDDDAPDARQDELAERERHPSEGMTEAPPACRGATWLIACSVSAVMVRLGLTPTLAGIAEPSQTSRFS